MGYDIESAVLQKYLSDMSSSLLSLFESTITTSINILTLEGRLQLLFDLLFLFQLLRFGDKTTTADPRRHYTVLLTSIDTSLAQAGIDRIDWTTCKPVMHQYVQAAVHRAQVIFGVFIKINPLPNLNDNVSMTASAASINNETIKQSLLTLPICSSANRIVPLTTSLLPMRRGKQSAANQNNTNTQSAHHDKLKPSDADRRFAADYLPANLIPNAYQTSNAASNTAAHALNASSIVTSQSAPLGLSAAQSAAHTVSNLLGRPLPMSSLSLGNAQSVASNIQERGRQFLSAYNLY